MERELPGVTPRLVLRTAWSLDLWVGAAAGIGLYFLASDHDVRKSAVTILLAEVGIGVAVLGAILTAMAIITAFTEGLYRLALKQAGKISRVLLPYFFTAVVAGSAAVIALLVALAWPAIGETPQRILLGLATGTTIWAVTGAVALVELTVFHAQQRAELSSAIESAKIKASPLPEGAKTGA